jgi:hypothetical protein
MRNVPQVVMQRREIYVDENLALKSHHHKSPIVEPGLRRFHLVNSSQHIVEGIFQYYSLIYAQKYKRKP